MPSGIKEGKIPGDIHFKCYPKKIGGIAVCALCDTVYHRSEYNETWSV